MDKYNPKKIEEKWQNIWDERDQFFTDNESAQNPYYILDMFPYPSGAGLHMGHIENFTATDILARYKRMNGFDVLRPMGWDAFGLPAENYAVKTGVHPRKTTNDAIVNFKRQIKQMGLSYDFHREIGTHAPEYYKWTQWLFLLFYKHNLVYKKKAKVNWDPVDKTVLANEQVLADGTAERSGAVVEQKELEQWFFRITEFAEQLHADLDTVDWPAHTVTNQRNWIGKSAGHYINFNLTKTNHTIRVFTTRIDTLMGATYLVLAPEHFLVDDLQQHITNWAQVEHFVEQAAKKTDRARTEKNVNGVQIQGIAGVHPITKQEVPIFLAEYVLFEYGTGAIMAVPAHDKRDWEFAQKYQISVVQVIQEHADKPNSDDLYEGEGTLVNSGELDGLSSAEAKDVIAKKVQGEKSINYRLRDWLISRQRYWGCPIPIVYSPEGDPHPVPDEHLPWRLPTDVEFLPTGTSPLAQSEELQKRTQEIFGKGWTPEVDTMDTFVDSSWYFLRFCDPHNDMEFASKDALNAWTPVDLYMGGAEHTVLHLLYARFFTKVLHKLGYVKRNEPFATLRHQGIILGEDNFKMSKSRGNVVNPDTIVDMYGADTARMYVMFMGPLEDSKAWQPQNIVGVHRFLGRVWGLVEQTHNEFFQNDESGEVKLKHHYTVKKVTEDIENLRYNTAIAALMEFVNVLYSSSFCVDNIKTLLVLLAPFAPHITEELWEKLGEKSSVHRQQWSSYNEKYVVSTNKTIPVFVNGKVRAQIDVAVDISEDALKQQALAQDNIKKYVAKKEIKNIIIKNNEFINIVI